MQTKTRQIVQSQPQTKGIAQSVPTWLPISLILGLATFLFTYRLESEGLWLDELTSVEDASLSLKEVYLENQLRPLYYLLLKGWMQLGSGDGWLRGLGVIFAIISVFLIYKLGRRLAGEAEGLIAALIFALSPLVVNHAQEIRMYTLSLCMTLAGTLFLADALLTKRPQHPSRSALAGWCLFRLLAICTVPLNVTLLVSDAIIIFFRFRKERTVLISFVKWALLLILLWSPSALSTIQEASPSGTFASYHTETAPPGPAHVFRLLKLWTVWPFAVQDNAIAAKLYKLFTLSLAGLVGASLFRKHKSPAMLWTLIWLAVPLLLIITFSYLKIPIWELRYVLFASPYLFILLAAGITRLWKQWKVSAIVIGIAYLIAVSGGLVEYYTVQQRSSYKFNIATIEQYEQPGDAIVWSYYYTKALGYYYHGTADVYHSTIRDIKTDADLKKWVSQVPTGYNRLWLVEDGSNPLKEELEAEISETYDIKQSFDYEYGSKVMLLTPLK
ncbi:MAG: glycosyltransferase family 39 protein [Phormidesmis sp.]